MGTVKGFKKNGTIYKYDYNELDNVPEGGGSNVEVDDTLTAQGKAADAKATGDAIGKLSEEKVTNPTTAEVGQILEVETVDENGKPKTYKASDKLAPSDEQVISAVNNYVTENPDVLGNPTDEQVQTAVDGWLNENFEEPEPLADGSVTEEKLADGVKEKITYIKYRNANLRLDSEIYTDKKIDSTTGDIIAGSASMAIVPITVGERYVIYGTAIYRGGANVASLLDENKTGIEYLGNYISNVTITNENAKYLALQFYEATHTTASVYNATICTYKDYFDYYSAEDKASHVPDTVLIGATDYFADILKKSIPTVVDEVLTDAFLNKLNKAVLPKNEAVFDTQDINLCDTDNIILDYIVGYNESYTAELNWRATIAYANHCVVPPVPIADGTYYAKEMFNHLFYDEDCLYIGNFTDIAYATTIRKITINGTEVEGVGTDGTIYNLTLDKPPRYIRMGFNGYEPMFTQLEEEVDNYLPKEYKKVTLSEHYKKYLVSQILSDKDSLTPFVKEISYPLNNGTWVAMGDSITQYFFDGGWSEPVKEKLGLAVAKRYALAGATWECSDTTVDLETTTVTSNIFGQYNSMKNDMATGTISPTIITIAMGTNCTNVGEFWADESNLIVNTDTTTLAGAMHTILQKLLSEIPLNSVRVGGIIPPQATGRNPERNEGVKARNDLMRRIYEYYAIPYLDMEKAGYILDANIVDNGTMGDTVHPSQIGDEIYARRLVGWMPTL